MHRQSTDSQNRFLKFIAYLQTIGIILVVLGHSFHEFPGGNEGRDMLLYRMMHSFRMPLFMFVSGFLMIYTKKTGNTISYFVQQKIKRLVLPFIVLTLITVLPRTLMSGMADDSLGMSMESFWKAFVYSDCLIIPYFWFLQASFILLVFNYTVITLGEKAGISPTILYLSVILLFVFLFLAPVNLGNAFSLNKVANFGIYFVMGSAYCRFANKIDRYIPWTSVSFLMGSALVWATLFFITENTNMVLLCSLFGIIMCISLAKIMEARDIRFIDHLIGANYIIFLLSWFCNVASQQILHHYVTLPWWCYTLLSLISGIYIPWLCYQYLCAHPDSRWVKITAFLLGQSLRKRHSNANKKTEKGTERKGHLT